MAGTFSAAEKKLCEDSLGTLGDGTGLAKFSIRRIPPTVVLTNWNSVMEGWSKPRRAS